MGEKPKGPMRRLLIRFVCNQFKPASFTATSRPSAYSIRPTLTVPQSCFHWTLNCFRNRLARLSPLTACKVPPNPSCPGGGRRNGVG